jgi:uncharacterized membrane protein
MIEVTLYSRKDCHLCDEVRTDLQALAEQVPHLLIEVDIDSDPKLFKKYHLEIPVVSAGPYTIKAPISHQDLEITLKAAQYRQNQIDSIDQAVASGALQIPVTFSKADRFSFWLSRHYLALFNLFIAFYVGFAFLAPVMMKAGWTAPASLIYRAYGVMCHQLSFRSWFLFGEQTSYPRSAARQGGDLTFQQATGLAEDDLWAAREYRGDDQVGFKIALCERDIAIYLGILLFGLSYAASGRKLKAIPWYVWILIGLVPIGLDGLSQLFSQPPLNLLPYRESTPLLRTITGFLFGFVTAWFGYPVAEEAMRDTRQYMETKQHKASQQAKPKTDEKD